MIAGCAAGLLPLVLCFALVFVPALSPARGAATADFLRSVVGPEPVARLESVSSWMHDSLYQLFPRLPGAGPAVSWSTSASPTAPLDTAVPSPMASLAPAATAAAPTPLPTPTPLPVPDVVTSPPQIGWQAHGPMPDGAPLMARALIMVDPSRSYAGVALVRMDLSRLRLHIMVGFIEPAHPSHIGNLIPNLGSISPQDESALVAAFNGGFKAVHGHYGMMVNGVTLLGPVQDMATVAVYQDGSVRLGSWGGSLAPSADMLAFRQNCPLLVEDGLLNPALSTNARKAWGITNNTDVTWRTGLGLSEDERYLIYAVGNGTTVQFLAEALQKAGAANAMQLDINQYYAHFVTYSQGSGHPQAERLLEQMIDERQLYLTPSPRDFFYLTLRQ